MTQDEEYLRLLAIFHYVVAGLAALFALFPIFHLVFGLFLILAPDSFPGHGEAPPAFIAWFFVVFAAMFIALGWTFAALVLTEGRFLAKRKHYLFCLVVAGIECIFMPFGTVLGIFTIIVLMREPVRQLFAAGNPAQPTGA
jgi:small-conductance mechanosensitive channel